MAFTKKPFSTTFSTKAYTLNSLIEEVASISTKADTATVIATLSPRAYTFSVKFKAIDAWLNGNLYEVLLGNTFITGVSARTRLLNALKYRKTHGYFHN